MTKKKALIVGNRPLTSSVIELSKNTMIIAADAGADRLLKYNIVPDWIIGDLDSISDKAITKLEEFTVTNKDIQKTDLEKALDYAFEKGATEVNVVGWAGGRIDHTITGLSLALDPRVRLIDDKFTVCRIDEKILVQGEEKKIFSLVAFPEARVSVTGARWNLTHEKLTMGGRGIHNEIGATGKVTIECHSGNLLLIEGDFVLPHD